MKYFFSASMVVTTVRKVGHYPTSRTAAFLAKRFAYLFELEENDTAVTSIAGMLKGDTSGWNWCNTHLAPPEYQALFEFGEWWSCETDVNRFNDGTQGTIEVGLHGIGIDFNNRAFFLVNLNRGRMLTVLSRK